MTRPSARERDSYMRGQMQEEWMKLVIKKYPGTKWADLAAFRLIENKLCGEWEGLSKCPEKEPTCTRTMRKNIRSLPAAAEALYNAAWRRSALIEIYKTEPNQKKSAEAKDRALALAQRWSASMDRAIGPCGRSGSSSTCNTGFPPTATPDD